MSFGEDEQNERSPRPRGGRLLIQQDGEAVTDHREMLDERAEFFRMILAASASYLVAIRETRQRFRLDLRQAKEVMVQAQGWAASLEAHERQIARELERAFFMEDAAIGCGLDPDTWPALAEEVSRRMGQGVSFDDVMMDLRLRFRPLSNNAPSLDFENLRAARDCGKVTERRDGSV